MVRFALPIVVIAAGVTMLLLRRALGERIRGSYRPLLGRVPEGDMVGPIVVLAVADILFGLWMLYVQLTL